MKKIFGLITAIMMTSISVLLGACASIHGGTPTMSYDLERNVIHVIYSGNPNREYIMPRVITNDKNFTVDWQIKSMSTDSGMFSVARNTRGDFVDRAGAKITDFSLARVRYPNNDTSDWRYSLLPIPNEDGSSEWGTIVFTANINGTYHRVQRDFTVRMRDVGESTFTYLYSFKHETLEPYEVGLASRRVFGLYDLKGNNYGAGKQNSGDTVDLAWRYKGKIALQVQLYDNANNRVQTWQPSLGNLTLNDSVVDLVATLNNNTTDGVVQTLRVNFKTAGVRKLRVVGTTPDPDTGAIVFPTVFNEYTPKFEYIYNIVDAINCYNFDEIKRIEKEARLDYIVNGVAGLNGTPTLAQTGRTLSDYYNSAAATTFPKHLSRQFNTVTRTSSLVGTANKEYRAYGRIVGSVLREFDRWTPAYRYEDIVVRANMRTWAEGTWFFGNVYGNGHILDATPYAQSAERRYRNVHGNEWEHAHEGEPFRNGHGWGDKFAFYMLANNSTIDNISLIGENIVKPGGASPLLNEYKTLSVLGTSGLAGGELGFWQGNAWDMATGTFKKNHYVENIRVMNSTIEKGLILVGANFAPDFANPVVVESSILRYAGFAGIYGRGYDNDRINTNGIKYGTDIQNRNMLGRVDKNRYRKIGGNMEIVATESLSCGNFVVAKNNIFYDICTSSIIGNDDFSGTHFRVIGEDNYFYTWTDSLKIVFPLFKMPGGLEELIITKIATGELARIMKDSAYDNVKLQVPNPERPGTFLAGYFVNLPFISVDTFTPISSFPTASNITGGANDVIVANVIDLGDEVFNPNHPNNPGSGRNFYLPATTSVEASGVGSVFAFTVVLLTNNQNMKTGTYLQQQSGLQNLYNIISTHPKAPFTVLPFSS